MTNVTNSSKSDSKPHSGFFLKHQNSVNTQKVRAISNSRAGFHETDTCIFTDHQHTCYNQKLSKHQEMADIHTEKRLSKLLTKY